MASCQLKQNLWNQIENLYIGATNTASLEIQTFKIHELVQGKSIVFLHFLKSIYYNNVAHIKKKREKK